jgi:hypothetical protein
MQNAQGFGKSLGIGILKGQDRKGHALTRIPLTLSWAKLHKKTPPFAVAGFTLVGQSVPQLRILCPEGLSFTEITD